MSQQSVLSHSVLVSNVNNCAPPSVVIVTQAAQCAQLAPSSDTASALKRIVPAHRTVNCVRGHCVAVAHVVRTTQLVSETDAPKWHPGSSD